MTDASVASGARIADYWLHEEVPARNTELAYRASHRVLPRRAHVAILAPAFVGCRPAEVQLMREACVLETLHHCGVPRVFECGVLDHRPWVASECIVGTTIEEAAAERPLPIPEALAVIRDAAAVLAHAHRRGVVHRDLTPSTIVRTTDRGLPICVTGWGEASMHGSTLPRPDNPGARFYRAPELTDGDRGGHCDPAMDVFALGAVIFEAATLVLPEPVQRFPGVPAALHQLLARMLARSPGDRPTAQAVHDEASRLAELFTGSDAGIEEVEVELVDISRTQAPTQALGWMPDCIVTLAGETLGSQPRRRGP